MNNNKIRIDTQTVIKFWLVPLAIVLIALAVGKALTALIILGLALFLALAISPLVNSISRRIPGHSRNFATALAYIIVVGILCAILAVVVPVVIGETTQLISSLPETLKSDGDFWNGLNSFGQNIGIDDLRYQVISAIDAFAHNFDFGGAILSGVSAVGSILAGFVLVLVLAFLMLIEGPSIMGFLKTKFGKNKRGPKAISAIERMGEVISKFISGELVVALINGCFTALTVFILSLIFNFSAGLALPFGLITGILCLIPIFGSLVGGIVISLLLLLSSPWSALVFFIAYMVYLQLESNIIYPKIQSKGLHLPTLIVLAAITIGIYTLGLIGAIIAVPIAGCIKVLIDEYTAD